MFQSGAKKGMAWLLCLIIWSGPLAFLADDAVTSTDDRDSGRFDNKRSALYAKQVQKEATSHAMYSSMFYRCRSEQMQQRRKKPSFSLPEKVERSLDLLDLI